MRCKVSSRLCILRSWSRIIRSNWDAICDAMLRVSCCIRSKTPEIASLKYLLSSNCKCPDMTTQYTYSDCFPMFASLSFVPVDFCSYLPCKTIAGVGAPSASICICIICRSPNILRWVSKIDAYFICQYQVLKYAWVAAYQCCYSFSPYFFTTSSFAKAPYLEFSFFDFLIADEQNAIHCFTCSPNLLFFVLHWVP